MKKLLLGALLAGSITMLSSCLDGDNDGSRSTFTYGVAEIDMRTGGNVIYYNDYELPIFDATLSSQIMDDKCYYVEFTIKDEDNPDVATAGYYKVTATNCFEIDKGTVMYVKTDTAVIKEDELPITNLALTNYVKGYLFLNSYIESMGSGQKNHFELSFNMDAEPVLESTKSVYQMYLRANKLEDGKTPTSNQIVPNAYNVKRYFDTISNKEKGKGNSEYYVKLNYIKSFDKDTVPIWATTEVISVAIPKD